MEPSEKTWTDEDYASLRRYELKLERKAQIRHLDELHEARSAKGTDTAPSSDPPEVDGGG